jgi:hypothetical protein
MQRCLPTSRRETAPLRAEHWLRALGRDRATPRGLPPASAAGRRLASNGAGSPKREPPSLRCTVPPRSTTPKTTPASRLTLLRGVKPSGQPLPASATENQKSGSWVGGWARLSWLTARPHSERSQRGETHPVRPRSETATSAICRAFAPPHLSSRSLQRSSTRTAHLDLLPPHQLFAELIFGARFFLEGQE